MSNEFNYAAIKNNAKYQRARLDKELEKKLIRVIKFKICENSTKYGILEFEIKDKQWESLIDKKINRPIPKPIVKKIKKYFKELGVSVSFHQFESKEERSAFIYKFKKGFDELRKFILRAEDPSL